MNDNTNILNKIAFKTQSYRKNYDLSTNNDHIITEHAGIISHLRIEEAKLPLLIGEYSFSAWNLSLAKILNININNLIKSLKYDIVYDELINQLINKNLDISKYDKMIVIQNLLVSPNYRKIGISQEFIESIYRDFYNKNTIILAFVKPLQENNLEFKDFSRKLISVYNDNIEDYWSISADEYFSLHKLKEKKDCELNSYKLFSVAAKCGFKRIDESNLFMFEPNIILQKIKNKHLNNI